MGGGNTIARHGEGAADGCVVLPLDVVQVVLDDLEQDDVGLSGSLGLEHEAFAEVACGDAGGVETLDQGEPLFDGLGGDVLLLRELLDGDVHKVAVLVEVMDDGRSGKLDLGGGAGGLELKEKPCGERLGVVVRPLEGLLLVVGGARGGASRQRRREVVYVGVPVDLRDGLLEVIGLEWFGQVGLAGVGDLVDCRSFSADRYIAALGRLFEEGVLDQLLLHQFEHLGQVELQQFDGLLKLQREAQFLRLSLCLSEMRAHEVPVSREFVAGPDLGRLRGVTLAKCTNYATFKRG